MPVISSRLSYWINHLSKSRRSIARRATKWCIWYSVNALLMLFMQIYTLQEPQAGLIIGTILLIAYINIYMLVKLYAYFYMKNYNKVYKLGVKLGEINYDVHEEFTSLLELHIYYKPYPQQRGYLDFGIRLEKYLLNSLDFRFPFVLIYIILPGLVIGQIYQYNVYWEYLSFLTFIAVWNVIAGIHYTIMALVDIYRVAKGIQMHLKAQEQAHEQLNEPQVLLQQTCGVCQNINPDIILQCQGLHYFHINCLNTTEGRIECPLCNHQPTIEVIV